MIPSEKDFKIIRKSFEKEKNLDRIRLGNQFVDDFLFEDQQIADIPINALRVIFNIISMISSEQFRPEDRPKQLSLFDEEFQTDNNVFVSMKIKNSKISPSGSTKQVIEAYEFLAKFKMGWYKSQNLNGKEIKTFGGLISTPSYENRGYTSFLISSYWLKRIIIIPEYNYILYQLVYHIKNNKHILFAIWLAKIPENGISLKLSTLNKKFGLNYKTAKDFCMKFLKNVRKNLDDYNTVSFHYHYQSDTIFIYSYLTKTIQKKEFQNYENENAQISYRLRYLKNRYILDEKENTQFFFHYRSISESRALFELAYKEFIRDCRLKNISTQNYQGIQFLNIIQNKIIILYKESKSGKVFPNGYPRIV